jgi:hypothetical protein
MGSLERRSRVFQPGMRLSYQRPVHPVSASGVWITEADQVVDTLAAVLAAR